LLQYVLCQLRGLIAVTTLVTQESTLKIVLHVPGMNSIQEWIVIVTESLR
jgi:hypothetical protein